MDPNNAQSGMTEGGYYISNDTWNAANYKVTQTLNVCSHGDWWVVANMDNSSGDGAVKTYPNAHMDFSEPTISSLGTITSTFAETSPHTGIYEDAYDIWINGVASSGSTEVMIWTENFGQTPGGSQAGTVTIGGHDYTVWKNGSYIAFVATTNFTSGTLTLSDFFGYVQQQGWIGSTATLGQIDYGAELVSTGGTDETFTFTNFSVTTNVSASSAGSRVGSTGSALPVSPTLLLLGAGLVMWRLRRVALRHTRGRF